METDISGEDKSVVFLEVDLKCLVQQYEQITIENVREIFYYDDNYVMEEVD